MCRIMTFWSTWDHLYEGDIIRLCHLVTLWHSQLCKLILWVCTERKSPTPECTISTNWCHNRSVHQLCVLLGTLARAFSGSPQSSVSRGECCQSDVRGIFLNMRTDSGAREDTTEKVVTERLSGDPRVSCHPRNVEQGNWANGVRVEMTWSACFRNECHLPYDTHMIGTLTCHYSVPTFVWHWQMLVALSTEVKMVG